jgi:hypothetical protein
LQPRNSEPEDWLNFLPYFLFFDKIFFFSAIQDNCGFSFVHPPLTDWGGNILHGKCRPLDDDFKPTNTLSSWLVSLVEMDGKLRLHSYIEILLHEMLHAYFQIYVCRCLSCEKRNDIFLGLTGHGYAWQLAAIQLEDVCSQRLGYTVNLGQAISFARELEERARVKGHVIYSYEISQWTEKVEFLVNLMVTQVKDILQLEPEVVATFYRE